MIKIAWWSYRSSCLLLSYYRRDVPGGDIPQMLGWAQMPHRTKAPCFGITPNSYFPFFHSLENCKNRTTLPKKLHLQYLMVTIKGERRNLESLLKVYIFLMFWETWRGTVADYLSFQAGGIPKIWDLPEVPSSNLPKHKLSLMIQNFSDQKITSCEFAKCSTKWCELVKLHYCMNHKGI
jgi:hypothetical protein